MPLRRPASSRPSQRAQLLSCAVFSHPVHPQGVAGPPLGLCSTAALTAASPASVGRLLRFSVRRGHHSCCSEFPSEALFPGVLWALPFPVCVTRSDTGRVFPDSGPVGKIAPQPLHFYTLIKLNMAVRLPLPGDHHPGSL